MVEESAVKKFTLTGKRVRLEPLEMRHVDGLVEAASGHPELYKWSFVPQSEEEVRRYVENAIALRNSGDAAPFATVSTFDDRVLGSTRLFAMERWAWPRPYEPNGPRWADACEIGYTWLAGDATRTGANTEAKLLMLTHAFETWRLLRVCLTTDERNERSRAAMERMGARFEGVLRAYRVATDMTPRNSARYSIVMAEWPEVKARLVHLRDKYD